MTGEKWQQLNELFSAVLEIAPPERAAWIAAQTDEEIREELGTLLKSHDASKKFLKKNAIEMSAGALLEIEAGVLIGQQIGHFKIVREIGRGGMGAVYLAERTGADFTQKAALKLIKRGMDTDFIVQRFQTERRILSKLSHPFIARLFDGGSTSDGLPYFTMEYIEGDNLSEFCRRKKPSVAEKLKLFRQICEAVSFAHRNLIVHRDLKPSNIIICDDQTPKLLDFGIAKLLDADSENTEKTTTEFRLLTPKYASPEQVRGEVAGTQSDVYSLGVILGEMLVNVESRKSKVESREDETPEPDFEIKDPVREESRVNRELKTIVNKAVHEDPVRRYASVEQLSEDVRRFQNNLPILAQPDNYLYRSQKFIRRHRAGVLAGALILLTLIGGMAATFWQFRQAQNERNLAEERFNDVRGLANSVIFDLHDEIQNLPGSTKARKLLIGKALEYLDKLQKGSGGDAGLEHELAMAYMKIADVQGQIMEASLLETDQAVENYRKAVTLAEKAVAAEPQNFKFRSDLGILYYRFAEALRGSNDLTESLSLERQSAEVFEPLAAENRDNPEIRRRLLIARSGVADVLRESGELEKSLPIYERNLDDSLTAAGEFPNEDKLQRFLAIAYGGYAMALFQHNELAAALKNIEISRKLTDNSYTKNPNDADRLRNLGVTCEHMGRFASSLNLNQIAEESAGKNVQIMEKIAADDAENLEAKYDVASSNNNYADFLEKNNRLSEAFDRRQKVLEAIVPLENNENNPEIYAADFFEFYARYARLAARLGKREAAEKYCRKAEALNFKLERTTGEIQNLYTNDLIALGDAYLELGNREKAKMFFAGAVETWRRLQAEGRFYPLNLKNLADAEEQLRAMQ